MRTNAASIAMEKTDDTMYNILIMVVEVTEFTIKNNMAIIWINYHPSNAAPAIIEVP